MTLRRQKKPSGKGCLPDATLKRFTIAPPRKQSKGWRFRLAKHGFYENKRRLEHPLPAISANVTALPPLIAAVGRRLSAPS